MRSGMPDAITASHVARDARTTFNQKACDTMHLLAGYGWLSARHLRLSARRPKPHLRCCSSWDHGRCAPKSSGIRPKCRSSAPPARRETLAALGNRQFLEGAQFGKHTWPHPHKCGVLAAGWTRAASHPVDRHRVRDAGSSQFLAQARWRQLGNNSFHACRGHVLNYRSCACPQPRNLEPAHVPIGDPAPDAGKPYPVFSTRSLGVLV